MASDPSKKHSLGNVLITGGCGFLGHHIVRVLLRDWTATSVTVLDLRCQRNRRPETDGVRYIEADITDAAKLAAVFDDVRPELVIHTASPPSQSSTASSDSLFKAVNIDGTQNIVDACRKTGVKALVYTSSASVTSDNVTDLINADERWPVPRGKDQTEYYTETKAAAEEIVLKANRADNSTFLTTAIRPAGIVGEGDIQAQYHIINIYLSGKSGFQVGNNDNLFDWTYVENVAHAHLLAVHALVVTGQAATQPLEHEKVDGEVFIITNDSPTYFWDFCRLIWNAAGSPHGLEHVWTIPRDVGMFLGLCSEVVCKLLGRSPTFNRQRIVYSSMTRYFCIDKAKRRLGYRPIISLEEGMRRSVKWTMEQMKEGNM
ncbi:3-beta hydroxysteroid dehydrogenase/isomerase family-domain-containing protein [Coniella lustricola]|uniref:Sterol-4-alpha-carboxylate 3-dehydrogenase ERG26, decarboxylating n=1 Tax=Coniella lustricola TaxID=2025994 RepID=A0A2T2ZU86_9PEZI|nr:3-beta hydroxysteroid dehydrogenase/isomerase family-domain-containing protein [Coniella lustricola]